jgi:hypothetical protein
MQITLNISRLASGPFGTCSRVKPALSGKSGKDKGCVMHGEVFVEGLSLILFCIQGSVSRFGECRS